jgi:tetratricopeptide (TPR) repeat protein
VRANYPIISYILGYCAAQMNDPSALTWYQKAAAQPPDYCFPIRLDEQVILEAARAAIPSDGRAAYYLGNLYYDKKQYDKAIAAWKIATELEPGFSIPWRNLGIALYNKQGDKTGAKHCFEQALSANPDDPRLPMEMDQLSQRLGSSPADRLAALEKKVKLVEKRDDLSMTLAELYSQTGQPQKALEILTTRHFHAFEGGEGGATGQYALAHILLGMDSARRGKTEEALASFKAGQIKLNNLGVGRGMSLYEVLSWFKTGEALAALGKAGEAHEYYQKIIAAEERLAVWGVSSSLGYYAALSLRAIGRTAEADEKLQSLKASAQKKIESGEEGGFFTSKPAMIVFDDDPKMASEVEGYYLLGLAQLGLGQRSEAEASFRSVLKRDPYHWWAQFQLSGQ